MAAATHATSAEYLKPLFKSLRKRVRSVLASFSFCPQSSHGTPSCLIFCNSPSDDPDLTNELTLAPIHWHRNWNRTC
jgi:hypothetical protein